MLSSPKASMPKHYYTKQNQTPKNSILQVTRWITNAADPSLTLHKTSPWRLLVLCSQSLPLGQKQHEEKKNTVKNKDVRRFAEGKNLFIKKAEAVNNRRRHNEKSFLADLLKTVKKSSRAELHPWWNNTNLSEQRARQNPQHPGKICIPWVIILLGFLIVTLACYCYNNLCTNILFTLAQNCTDSS